MENYPIWHPFSQMKGARLHKIVRAEGAFLYDAEGNKITDAISSWWVNTHGHGHPHIAKAIAHQAKELEHVMFAGFTHEPAIQLAKRLLKHLPASQEKLFFSDNGSTATEVALKMAIQYWYNIEGPNTRRKKIMAFKGSYHGDTFGAMSVGERDVFVQPFMAYLFDVHFIDLPTLDNVDDLMDEVNELMGRGDVAAFIFEPLVQGAAGMQMYGAEQLDALLSLCRKHDVLTIADEVMTGFGRTGTFFAVDQLRESVDLLCMSKGLTGGFMALGLTSCTQKIYKAFYSDALAHSFFHGHSFTGNPLACAAANANLDLMEKAETWEAIERISDAHQAFAARLVDRDLVKNLRITGSILAFEVAGNKEQGYLDPVSKVLYDRFMAAGVLLRPIGNTVYILPPYCIGANDLAYIYQVIEEVLQAWKNPST